jgi:hypothetical protein
METTTSTPSPRRVSRGVLAGLVAAVGIAAVAAGVLIARDDDNQDSVGSSSQVASVSAACQSWLDSDPTQPGTAGWCNGMADWMTQRMTQGGMGPQMMWGDPDRMRDTCQQWMTANPPGGTDVDAQSWCDSMVGWMSDHMGDWSGRDDWDDWTMHGMGGR